MNYALLIPLVVALCATASVAQERIYRCGNEYTNMASVAQARGCKLMEGGNVTVVQGTRATASTAPGAGAAGAGASSGAARVDSNEQKARDSDARQILESELRKTEARHVELLKEYNNGEPEKRGDESRNHQKYLDRVAELKASLARNESDLAGIRRELARIVPASAAK